RRHTRFSRDWSSDVCSSDLVVHRLDRPVSGVVVLARTSKALSRMNKLFSERETIKTYLAIVAHRPPANEGRLVHWLRKDEVKNRSEERRVGKECRSRGRTEH